MARSFLQRLLGKRNRGFEARPPAETPTSRVPDQEHLKSQQARSEILNFQPTAKVNSLFAFVDLKDPFTPGEIASSNSVLFSSFIHHIRARTLCRPKTRYLTGIQSAG